MNPSPATTAAAEINRLHEEAKGCSVASRKALQGALAAAWHAGQLLLVEKKRVNHKMGRGAWCLWLETNFRGAERTAQRYMRLAECVADSLTKPCLRAYDRFDGFSSRANGAYDFVAIFSTGFVENLSHQVAVLDDDGARGAVNCMGFISSEIVAELNTAGTVPDFRTIPDWNAGTFFENSQSTQYWLSMERNCHL